MRNVALIWLAGCATALEDDTPYVDTPRVLAVRSEPPEVEPGGSVTFTALFADETGALSKAPLDWAFCTDPKPLAELGPVSSACLDLDRSLELAPFGFGLVAQGQVPADACSLFGPNPPPAEEGQPAGRPADPDITGGYYQPALAFPDPGFPTLAPVRIRCGIANVSQETYVAWNVGYTSNVAPRVEELLADGVPVPPEGDDAPPSVAAGETVTLTASWAACGDSGGCPGAETYVLYDPATGELGSRREAVSASWFTTGGAFAEARNGLTGEDEGTSIENRWTAPEREGEVWLAVVLRDERGGVDYATYRIDVGR